MIYVDDYLFPATVCGIKSNWSHLFSMPPDVEELAMFGERIGLRRRWLQHADDPWRAHFDVTITKRKEAIENGAVEIGARRAAEMRLEFKRRLQ